MLTVCRSTDVTTTVCDPIALHKGLDKAIAEFELDVKLGRSQGPYLVASRVYENVYESWSLEIESHWKVCFVKEAEEKYGSVWLYGDPSRIHDFVLLYIHELKEQLVAMWYSQGGRGVFRSRDVLAGLGSARLPLRVDNYVINKEADVAWVPAQTPNAFPSFVVEIAYRNESIPRLKQEMKWWSKNGVALTLGIKIEMKRGGGGVLFERYIFLMLDHEDGTETFHEVNFSPQICNLDNREEFVQRIQMRKIMRGFDTGFQRELELELDLFDLQQEIKSLTLAEAPVDESLRVCFCRHNTNEGSLVEESSAGR